MEKVYIACFILGFIFLLVSIFTGMDTDADIEINTDVDVDIDADLDSDIGSNAHGEGAVEAVKFLSLRNIIFFVAFFGFTGTVLTYLKTEQYLTVASSVLMGLFTAFVGHKALSYLKRTEVGEGKSLSQLVGHNAKVLVSVTKNSQGKISVTTDEQLIQILAMVADESTRDEFKSGDEVVIVKIEGGTAYVGEKEFINS